MYGYVITTAGWELIATLIAGGHTLEISRVMVGTGKVPAATNPIHLTDLIAPVAQGTSSTPIVTRRDNGATVSFVVQYRSDLSGGIEQGFLLNEFGVFAFDAQHNEKLIYYATLGDSPDPVSAAGLGGVEIRSYPVSMVLTDELNVTVAYPPLAFLTSDDLELWFTQSALPRIDTRIADNIAAHNVHVQSHPDIRAMINNLAGRVSRLEDMFRFDVTANPFTFAFDDLVGYATVEGVWNRDLQRIEF